MGSGSAAGSPIFPIRTAAARASRCPRTRSGATRGAATRSSADDSRRACFSGSFWPSAGRSPQPSSCARAADRRPRTSTSAGRRWLPSRPWSRWPSASKLPYDFTLAGVPLFREAETDHVLVCGAPGSGKGVAIKELLDQIRARGDRAILYDPSGEYVQVYYRHGKDVLLNPLDARSPAWTLWGEVREAYDYASLAASIIPENEKVNDPFWREGPRGLFEAVALRLAERGEATNAAFRHMISIAPLAEVFALVKGTEAAPAIDPAAEKMAIGVRATVSTKIRAWAYLPDPEAGQTPFSVRRFVEHEEGDAWLFLTSRKDQHAFFASGCEFPVLPELSRRAEYDALEPTRELPPLKLSTGAGIPLDPSYPQVTRSYVTSGSRF